MLGITLLGDLPNTYNKDIMHYEIITWQLKGKSENVEYPKNG